MVGYTALRQLFGFSLGERFEQNIFNGLVIAAVGVFVLNRKLVADEAKAANEAKAAAEAKAAGELEPAAQDKALGVPPPEDADGEQPR